METKYQVNFHSRKKERTEHYFAHIYMWRLRACTACSGSGRYTYKKCGACNGTGKERYKHQEKSA